MLLCVVLPDPVVVMPAGLKKPMTRSYTYTHRTNFFPDQNPDDRIHFYDAI